MSKPTKGEWNVMAGAEWNILDETGLRIAWCNRENGRKGSDAEDIANARLMAASKRLYNALAAALVPLGDMAEQTCYGTFCGGDPRLFTPDPECSTEEERAYHKKACEMADAGQIHFRADGVWEFAPGYATHKLKPQFGMGTQRFIYEPAKKVLDEALAALAIARGERSRDE